MSNMSKHWELGGNNSRVLKVLPDDEKVATVVQRAHTEILLATK